MKTLKLITIGIILFLSGALNAQVSIRENISSPPMWGPVVQNDARYYYLPDVKAYYDVNASKFIYQVKRGWVHRDNLPKQYRGYDLYNGKKIMITGCINFDKHQVKNANAYYYKDQITNVVKPAKDTSTDKIAQLEK